MSEYLLNAILLQIDQIEELKRRNKQLVDAVKTLENENVKLIKIAKTAAEYKTSIENWLKIRSYEDYCVANGIMHSTEEKLFELVEEYEME
jgi:hypothetical protein